MTGEIEEQEKYDRTLEKQREDVIEFRLTTSVSDVKNGDVFNCFEVFTDFLLLQGASYILNELSRTPSLVCFLEEEEVVEEEDQ